MESTRFDRLTKTLAGATSRRQALKALAVAAVGGAIGVRTAGTAYAAGNSNCAHFCTAVFGGDTAASAQCTADAAHRTGLCYTCGPASPTGGVLPENICCARNSDGLCASYSDAACCNTSAGQFCQNGACVTLTTTHVAVTTTGVPVPVTTVAPM